MLKQIFTVWNYRHFWKSLVINDLRIRYRRSVLGIGWSLLNPIVTTIVFCLVFSKLNGMTDWRRSAPYFLSGLCIWDFIKQCATQGCQTFYRNEPYIRQCPLPLMIYTLRTVLGVAIHSLIALAVVLAAVLLYAEHPAKQIAVLWAVLLGTFMMLIFGWALSVVTSFLNVYFHDTNQLLEVVFHIFFFLTPIIYPVSHLEQKNLTWLMDINPAAYFLQLIRTPLLDGTLPAIADVAMAIGATVVTVALAVTLIARLEKRLIFRL